MVDSFSLENVTLAMQTGEEGYAGTARTRGGVGPAEAPIEKVIIDARRKRSRSARRGVSGRRCRWRWLQAGALVKAERAGEIDDELGLGSNSRKT